MKQWISFVVGGAEYVADSLSVQKVVRSVKVTPLPDISPGVLGVTNLHGQIVPVLDTSYLFGAGGSYEQAVIINTGSNSLVALPVEEVKDVEIDRGDSVQPSPVSSDLVVGFIVRNGRAAPVVNLEAIAARAESAVVWQ